MKNGKILLVLLPHINIGEDSCRILQFCLRGGSVMNGDGTEAPVSFGAAPYFAAGKDAQVQMAKLFELLGEQVEMKGNTLYLGGTEN